MTYLDIVIFRLLNSVAFWNPPVGGWIDTVIVFKSIFLGWWILIILIVLLIIDVLKKKDVSLIPARGGQARLSALGGNRRMVAQAIFAGIISRFVFTEIIRFFYNRPRPFEVLDSVNQLIFHSPGYSFPSGHAAFFSAIAASIFFFNKVWGIIFFGIALYMGTGRIEAGIHWPSDIVGGMLVGLFSAWLVQKVLYRKIKSPS